PPLSIKAMKNPGHRSNQVRFDAPSFVDGQVVAVGWSGSLVPQRRLDCEEYGHCLHAMMMEGMSGGEG
ncbi:hypothetical protein FS837_006761, partial [Tulasnella sp. UAMH 9824]